MLPNPEPNHTSGTIYDTAARNEEIRRERAKPRPDRPTLAALSKKHNLSRERVRQIAAGDKGFVSHDGRLRMKVGDASIFLLNEGSGRYEIMYRGPEVTGRVRVGVVMGGARRWAAELRGGKVIREVSLRRVAIAVGEWINEDVSRVDGLQPAGKAAAARRTH